MSAERTILVFDCKLVVKVKQGDPEPDARELAEMFRMDYTAPYIVTPDGGSKPAGTDWKASIRIVEGEYPRRYEGLEDEERIFSHPHRPRKRQEADE